MELVGETVPVVPLHYQNVNMQTEQ